jgi:hypothetical protein
MNQMTSEIRNAKAVLAMAVFALGLGVAANGYAQATAFTYQGRLNRSTGPVNGSYDLRFTLYTAELDGSYVVPILTNIGVNIAGGSFVTALDFGNGIFTGLDRWLEIAVRPSGTTNFIPLNPRQPLRPAPAAIYANTVDAGGLLGTIAAANIAAGTLTDQMIEGGTLTAGKLAPDQVVLSLNNLRDNVTLAGGINTTVAVNGNTLSLDATNVWQKNGNRDIKAGTEFLGTLDKQPLELRVNGVTALRLQYPSSGFYPNLVVGYGNAVDTYGSSIAGGHNNTIETNAFHSFIGGGMENTVQSGGKFQFLGGGWRNCLQDGASFSTLAGGYYNTNSGYTSIIPGGAFNVTRGDYSLAVGYRAKANHEGTFVWADHNEEDFSSTAINGFFVRCTGGVKFVTAINTNGAQTAGVRVVKGSGTWESLSDREAKENFRPVDTCDVLEKVAALPLMTWNYRAQDSAVPHLGPVAQDFHAAFGLGSDNQHIATVDADGVALAAIQGLNQKLAQTEAVLRAELQAKDARLQVLERTVTELREQVSRLTAK